MPWVDQWPIASPNLAGTFRDIDTHMARALATGDAEHVAKALDAIQTRLFYLGLDMAAYRRKWAPSPQMSFADLYTQETAA
jgi:cob(I)alamin adenosyltransferase